jgi:hypothetical protein
VDQGEAEGGFHGTAPDKAARRATFLFPKIGQREEIALERNIAGSVPQPGKAHPWALNREKQQKIC